MFHNKRYDVEFKSEPLDKKVKYDLELYKGTLHQITFDLQLYHDALHLSAGSELAELRFT